jgi:hypothetical protein
MAGLATDTWTQQFTVDVGGHTVVVELDSDGVNEPSVSATFDGRPAKVTVATIRLVDGTTPAYNDLADLIRAAHPSAVKARFDVEEWDNGLFFTNCPKVELEDGSDVDHQIGELDNYASDLSDDHGPLGRDSQLVLDLLTATAQFEVNGGLF